MQHWVLTSAHLMCLLSLLTPTSSISRLVRLAAGKYLSTRFSSTLGLVSHSIADCLSYFIVEALLDFYSIT